jgi:hypothetical protein
MTAALVSLLVLGGIAVALAVALALAHRPQRLERRTRVGRVLVPFTGGALDERVLAAAIRIARSCVSDRRPARARRERADAERGRGCDADPRGDRARRAARRSSGRRTRRERADSDPRTEAALGRRAIRPDRRARAGRPEPGFLAQGPDVDAHPRAERDRDPAARSGCGFRLRSA